MLGAYQAFVTDYPPLYELAGYDFVSRLEVFRPFDGERREHSFRRADGTYTIAWDATRARITIARDGRELAAIAIAPLLEKARAVGQREVPQSVLTLEAETPAARVRAVFDDISARDCGAVPCVYHFKADVLVGAKSAPTGTKR